jgi:dTMP kinase
MIERYRGHEYALEGIDGGGKTTQIRSLGTYYRDSGYKVAVLPGISKTPFGLMLRRHLSFFNNMGVVGVMFFKEDLRRTYARLNGSEEADLVLWDRHLYSIYAANKLLPSMEKIRRIRPKIPEPGRAILLDLDPTIACCREEKAAKGDHALTLQWLGEKRQRYQDLAREEPERFQIVDASRSLTEVFNQLVELINSNI